MTPFNNSVRCANTKFKQGLPSLVKYSCIFMRGGVSGVSQKFRFDSCCLRLTPKIKYALIIISTTANQRYRFTFISNVQYISWLCFDFHQIKETFGKTKKKKRNGSNVFFFLRPFWSFRGFEYIGANRRRESAEKSRRGGGARGSWTHHSHALLPPRQIILSLHLKKKKKKQKWWKMADVSAHTLVDVYCITYYMCVRRLLAADICIIHFLSVADEDKF